MAVSYHPSRGENRVQLFGRFRDEKHLFTRDTGLPWSFLPQVTDRKHGFISDRRLGEATTWFVPWERLPRDALAFWSGLGAANSVLLVRLEFLGHNLLFNRTALFLMRNDIPRK